MKRLLFILAAGLLLLAACGAEAPTAIPTEVVIEPTEEVAPTPTEEMIPTPTEEIIEEPTEAPTEEIVPTPTEEMMEEPTEEPMEEAMEPNMVTVDLVSFAIEMPDTLPAGATIFEVTNAADFEHNFVIEGEGIEETFETNLQPGETGTLEIDLPPGTYEIYCPVGNHRAQGMELTLTVTEEEESSMNEMDLSVGLELVADGFTAPVAMVPAPDDSGRLFVVDQTGQIYIISGEGEMMAEPFLDIQDRMVALGEQYDERGLLGMAFHPEFLVNGRFFIYYSAPLRAEAPQDWDHTSHVSAFTVSADNPDAADPASEQIILQVDQPQGNHNAGSIAFGPDGYLYVPLGDGGGADDVGPGHVEDWYETNEGGNGQDLAQNLLGSILRIDVDTDGSTTYEIPADNPFAGEAGAEPVWAIGFRNPYRMSFDMGGDQALFVGDAGQNLWEEVSIVEGGGNYGWNVKEGTHCFSTANPDQSLDECPDMDADGRSLTDPIIEYQNGNAEGGLGLVVIGGNVYRGSALPDWEGVYIFGDWSTGFGQPDGTLLAAMPPAADGEMWTMQEVTIAGSENGRLNEYLLSFGQDNNGEVYVLTNESAGPAGTTGKVYRIVSP